MSSCLTAVGLRLAGLALVLVHGTLQLYLNSHLHDHYSYVVDGAGNSKVLYLMPAVGSLCVSARLFDRLEDASKENKSRYIPRNLLPPRNLQRLTRTRRYSWRG